MCIARVCGGASVHTKRKGKRIRDTKRKSTRARSSAVYLLMYGSISYDSGNVGICAFGLPVTTSSKRSSGNKGMCVLH